MEPLIKALQEKYIEDIRAKYPIHRVLCLSICLIGFYLSQQCDSLNLLESLKEIKIIFFMNLSDGFFSDANIYQLIAAIFMVTIISRINNYIKSSCFEFIAKINNLDAYLKNLRKPIEKEKNKFSSSRKSEIKNELNERRSVLKAMQAKSEVILTCIVCLLINMHHIELIEAIICILLAWGVIDQQWESYKYYLSKFIPYYVANDVVMGEISSEAEIAKDAFK